MASDGGSGGRTSGKRVAEGNFEWVTSSPSPAEVAQLEAYFPEVVQLPVEELAEEARSWQQRAVLMRTFRRWVPVEAFVREFRRGGISGEIIPISLAFRSYIFRFEDEETRDLVMQRPWVINGQPVAVEAWRPDFIPAADAISSALLWIRMPYLPIEFWREEFLRELVLPAGQFLCVDSATAAKTRGGYARVCAQVDLRSPLRPGTRVRGANGTFWQPFVYEQLDGICLRCGSLHLSGSCSPPARQVDEASPEAGLFGAWMSAVRQRKEEKGPQVDDRRTKQVAGSHASSAPRASSPVRSPAQGMQADGWQVQPKLARRRRSNGLPADSMQNGGSEVSPVPKSQTVAVAEPGLSISERAGCKGDVPVSVEVQESEHFPSHLITKNPFAALEVESGVVSQLRSRDDCPGPLKRARPAEYQAPRQISIIDKKKGEKEASSSKAKQVKAREKQYLNFDTGSTEKVQPKGLGGELSQPSMETDSSSDPLISVVVCQGSELRPSDNSPRANMIQDEMTSSHQSPASDMVEDQGGYQPPLPIK